MTRYFKDNPTLYTRALQIRQILTAKAPNRLTMTYGVLAHALGFRGAQVMSTFLDPVMCYCRDNQFPPLTIIVVNS